MTPQERQHLKNEIKKKIVNLTLEVDNLQLRYDNFNGCKKLEVMRLLNKFGNEVLALLEEKK